LIFVNRQTYEIIAIFQAEGKMHDFKMYKDFVGSAVHKDIKVRGDSGFQGIGDYHANSETPKKKSKKNPLTKEEKANNQRIARERILIENINAKLKVFKILALKYRNRRNRHNLRMSLVCGIYNFELGIN